MKWQYIGLLIVGMLIFSGCGQQAPTPAAPAAPATLPSEETLEPGVLSPGQIDSSMIDQAVKVRGKVLLVHQDPGGLAIRLSGGGGEVGVRIETDTWEALTEEEKAQFEVGKTATAEGMLVLTGEGELFVILGVIPPSPEPERPKMASVEIIAGPVNLSNSPKGSKEWPWPWIFIRNQKLVITYRGIVNGWGAQWLIEFDGNTWSQPLEIPPGEVVIGEKGAYTLSAWKYTDYEDMGNAGVVMNVLDDNFKMTKSITVDTTPCLHSIDRGTFPVGAIDSRGNFHIIWSCDTEAETDVYYAKFDGKDLTERVSVSNAPEVGSLCQTIAIDDNDVVYAFWAQLSEGWMAEDADIYYSFLENGEWSEPKNLSSTADWYEYGAMPFANGLGLHVFYGSSRGTEPGQMSYVVLRKDEIVRAEKANFSFTDIALTFEGDKIHAVYGGWHYASPYVSPEEELILEGKVYYNYFDGQEWYAGMGAELLPQEFCDNSEILKLDASTVVPDKQDKVTHEDGEIGNYREIRPRAVYKDGIIHTVFEHNQQGTYDAYYIAFRGEQP